MSISIRTNKGIDGKVEVKTQLRPIEQLRLEDIRKELAFIDAKLARAGTAPAQLTVRRVELEEALAALSE